MIWRMLNKDHMATASFSQISLKAWESCTCIQYANNVFDFLLFCSNREWKLQDWSTRSFIPILAPQLIQSDGQRLEYLVLIYW